MTIIIKSNENNDSGRISIWWIFLSILFYIININLQFYTSEFNRWLELEFEILDN